MLEGTICVVAGASGFLGRRLAELLQQEGAAVRALVRPSSRVVLPQSIAIVRCPLADGEALAAALDGADILFNCIGHSADWGAWESFHEGNIESVEHLWRAAARAGVGRILHVSTTDVYGYPRSACDESQPLIDVGLPYNRSKIAGDRLARGLGSELGLDVTVVRPATIFGPGSHDWVLELGRLLQAGQVPTIRGGRTNAGLVFVDDVGYAMIELAAVSDAAGEAYNVVDPSPISWYAYLAGICEVMGARPPRVDIPEGLALSLAFLSETVWRCLGMKRRPLFTRHAVYVMCRDQHYGAAKLCEKIARFPRVGLAQGLDTTWAWLAEQLRERGGKL